MNITPRAKQILTVLLAQEQPISVGELSEQVGVSKRTVQREFDGFPKVLEPFQLQFISKTGVGIWIQGESQNKKEFSAQLKGQSSADYSDKSFRRKSIILELLREKGLKKIFWYSNKFQVSDATISADLEAIEEWLANNNLTLTKKPGSGVTLLGSEEDYRRAIRAFVSENIDAEVMHQAYAMDITESKSYQQFANSGLGQMLNGDILKRVANSVGQIQHERIEKLTESAYTGLLIHIAIAMNRILKHETVDFNKTWLSHFEEDDDYQLAEQIVCQLELEFEINIPPVEISYICLHIKGSKHEKFENTQNYTQKPENMGLKSLINDLIQAFDQEKAYFLKQDEEFLNGLLAHLQPSIVRLAYDMQIDNPILEDIKRDYPEIYAKCENMRPILEQWTSKSVPDAEIGFLAVHFGAALVRLAERSESARVVDIGVICASGIGVSRLMASKLQKIFRNRVRITPYGKREITPEIVQREDFFIVSMHMDDLQAHVIEVNPLLNQADIEKIHAAFAQYEHLPKQKVSVAHPTTQLDIAKIHILTGKMQHIIRTFTLRQLPQSLTFSASLEHIANVATEDTVARMIICKDIATREKLSTQIFSELSFALLHARTDGVTKPTFCAIIPQDGDSFTSMDFRDIKVVFGMLIPNNDEFTLNSQLLGHISASLVDNDRMIDATQQGDVPAVQYVLDDIFKDFLRNFIHAVS